MNAGAMAACTLFSLRKAAAVYTVVCEQPTAKVSRQEKGRACFVAYPSLLKSQTLNHTLRSLQRSRRANQSLAVRATAEDTDCAWCTQPRVTWSGLVARLSLMLGRLSHVLCVVFIVCPPGKGILFFGRGTLRQLSLAGCTLRR